MYYKIKENFIKEMKQLRVDLAEAGFDNLDDLMDIIRVSKDIIFKKDDETVSEAMRESIRNMYIGAKEQAEQMAKSLLIRKIDKVMRAKENIFGNYSFEESDYKQEVLRELYRLASLEEVCEEVFEEDEDNKSNEVIVLKCVDERVIELEDADIEKDYYIFVQDGIYTRVEFMYNGEVDIKTEYQPYEGEIQ